MKRKTKKKITLRSKLKGLDVIMCQKIKKQLPY